MKSIFKWLTTYEAGQFSGYHTEYIRLLVRSGAIVARKWGNSWMVSEESLLTYLSKAKDSNDKRHGPKKGKAN